MEDMVLPPLSPEESEVFERIKETLDVDTLVMEAIEEKLRKVVPTPKSWSPRERREE